MKKTAILIVVLFLSVGAFAQEKAKLETTKQSSPSSAPVYSAEYRMGGINRHRPRHGESLNPAAESKTGKDGYLEFG